MARGCLSGTGRSPDTIASVLDLSTPVQYVKGIGPRTAEMLATKGLSTVEDLLYYLPFRYEDRVNPRGIAELRPGEMASVVAEVRTSGLFRTRAGPMFQLTVGQGRQTLKCLWFHGAYLKDRFQPGQLLALYGKVEESKFGRRELQIIQPQFEVLHDPAEQVEDVDASKLKSLEIGRIVPIYESAANGKLTSKFFRRVIHGALENLTQDVPDAIPAVTRGHVDLMERRAAFWKAHWPDEGESFTRLQDARTAAHTRLIFEELFFLELGLELKRRKMRAQRGIPFRVDEQVRSAIKQILPFHPTAAQKRVLGEIVADMKQPSPMRRLLQGEAAGYRIVLLTGSLEQDRKRETRRHIAQGNAQLVIGTHALIQEKVEFDALGLVIVDEQHRFGVMQRFKLMKKTDAAEPDVLVMTDAHRL